MTASGRLQPEAPGRSRPEAVIGNGLNRRVSSSVLDDFYRVFAQATVAFDSLLVTLACVHQGSMISSFGGLGKWTWVMRQPITLLLKLW